MSRRRSRRGAEGRPPAGPDPGARGAGGIGAPPHRFRWPLVIAAAAAVVLVAWIVAGRRPATRGVAAPSTAAALSPEAAYHTALRLSKAGRHEESLPYYRQAVTGSPEHAWVVHYNFGGALYNVGLEVRERHGVAVPVVRSSIERVALMREALAELDIAERLARTPRDRAMVLRARGERFQIWGFPWEAFIMVREAQWTDSASTQLGRIADGYLLTLEHPERGRPAPADAAASR